jgi:hypothetical protein
MLIDGRRCGRSTFGGGSDWGQLPALLGQGNELTTVTDDHHRMLDDVAVTCFSELNACTCPATILNSSKAQVNAFIHIAIL